MKCKINKKCIGRYLIIFSFIVYAFIPIVLKLNLNLCMRASLIGIINIMSWGSFIIGGILQAMRAPRS